MLHRKLLVPSTRAVSLDITLAHSFGAVFDNPDLVAACIVGDGESETGPLGNFLAVQQSFLNPKTDGAVLPIPASERI